MRRNSLKRRLAAQASDSGAEDLPQSAGEASGSRKGGVRKRLQATAAGSASSTEGSLPLPMNTLLIKKWCAGKMSSPEVQEMALVAAQQGVIHKIMFFGFDFHVILQN